MSKPVMQDLADAIKKVLDEATLDDHDNVYFFYTISEETLDSLKKQYIIYFIEADDDEDDDEDENDDGMRYEWEPEFNPER